MVGMSSIVARGGWTRDDLARLPDDGQRYEILDGALVVSPSPVTRHQFVVGGLYRQLFPPCPGHLMVVIAPLDVVLGDRDVLIPDLLVARRDQFDRRGLPGRPELAIEILSPSTRRTDRTVKLKRYERADTPAYWLADPDELTLTAYELRDGRYTRAAHVTADQTWTAHLPYEVTITPATWLD